MPLKSAIIISLGALLLFCVLPATISAEGEFQNTFENDDALVQWNTTISKPAVIPEEQFHANLELFSEIRNLPGGMYGTLIKLVNEANTEMTIDYDVIARRDQTDSEILLGSYDITKPLPTLKVGAHLDFPDEKVPTEGYLAFPKEAEFGNYTLYARFTKIEAEASMLITIHKDITDLVGDYLPPGAFDPGIELAKIELAETAPSEDISPEVIAISPNDQTDVPTDTAIEVTFNEPVDSLSAQSAFTIAPEISGEFSLNGNILTFTPEKKFSRNTEYTITIGTGVRDLSGNAMTSEFSAHFTTKPGPSRMWILYTFIAVAFVSLASYLIFRLIRRKRRKKLLHLEA